MGLGLKPKTHIYKPGEFQTQTYSHIPIKTQNPYLNPKPKKKYLQIKSIFWVIAQSSYLQKLMT